MWSGWVSTDECSALGVQKRATDTLGLVTGLWEPLVWEPNLPRAVLALDQSAEPSLKPIPLS